MSIERKVAIITGASQGLGAELVRAYRNRNYRVVANSRSIAPSRDSDVLAVAADIIHPPMNPEATHEALAKLHPVGRMGEARDIAEAVLYLEHAPFVTGEILRVDGGQHAGRW